MCFEYEADYYRRVEEARKAREIEEKKKQGQPAGPAVPGEADKGREQAQPVPA